MSIREKYKLNLFWRGTEKPINDTCKLSGSYFSGPVLKIAKKINNKDSIVIDLTPQYNKILSNHYFIELSWEDTRYIDDKVYLINAKLKGDLVNEISNLSNSDYILIDTEKHEEKIHIYNLVYKGMVMTKEGKEKND